MTKKLYYEDVNMKEFTSVVTDVSMDNGQFHIALEATAFYPEGGGQLADRGVLILEDGGEYSVSDVHEKDGIIWHYLDHSVKECAMKAGDEVHGILDWERRFDHMQQHSGEHIVSGMICSRFNCDNVGFHMGEDMVTIDYNARISYEEILEIEAEANRYIWENHAFTVQWPTPEELKTLEYRSKKELTGDVRITSFPGADMCACCGTHVETSAQVGLVKFLSAKNFHEGTRFELLCGKRAMDYLSMNYNNNKAVAVQLSTSEANTPEHVEKLIKENIAMKADNTSLGNRLIELMAGQYADQGDVLIVDGSLDPAQGRSLADMIAETCHGMVAVFTKSGSGHAYSVIKRNSDISAFIKEMNTALNGRGGGRNGFAQGSVQAGKSQIEEFWKTHRPVN